MSGEALALIRCHIHAVILHLVSEDKARGPSEHFSEHEEIQKPGILCLPAMFLMF